MHTTSRRPTHVALGLATVGVLALAACSGDDGGGSTDAFCEEIAKLAEPAGETTEEEDVAALRAVAEAAPSQISDEMDELLQGFEQLQAFDPEEASDEDIENFLAISDSLDQASTAVEEFAIENCPDLPASLFDAG